MNLNIAVLIIVTSPHPFLSSLCFSTLLLGLTEDRNSLSIKLKNINAALLPVQQLQETIFLLEQEQTRLLEYQHEAEISHSLILKQRIQEVSDKAEIKLRDTRKEYENKMEIMEAEMKTLRHNVEQQQNAIANANTIQLLQHNLQSKVEEIRELKLRLGRYEFQEKYLQQQQQQHDYPDSHPSISISSPSSSIPPLSASLSFIRQPTTTTAQPLRTVSISLQLTHLPTALSTPRSESTAQINPQSTAIVIALFIRSQSIASNSFHYVAQTERKLLSSGTMELTFDKQLILKHFMTNASTELLFSIYKVNANDEADNNNASTTNNPPNSASATQSTASQAREKIGVAIHTYALLTGIPFSSTNATTPSSSNTASNSKLLLTNSSDDNDSDAEDDNPTSSIKKSDILNKLNLELIVSREVESGTNVSLRQLSLPILNERKEQIGGGLTRLLISASITPVLTMESLPAQPPTASFQFQTQLQQLTSPMASIMHSRIPSGTITPMMSKRNSTTHSSPQKHTHFYHSNQSNSNNINNNHNLATPLNAPPARRLSNSDQLTSEQQHDITNYSLSLSNYSAPSSAIQSPAHQAFNQQSNGIVPTSAPNYKRLDSSRLSVQLSDPIIFTPTINKHNANWLRSEQLTVEHENEDGTGVATTITTVPAAAAAAAAPVSPNASMSSEDSPADPLSDPNIGTLIPASHPVPFVAKATFDYSPIDASELQINVGDEVIVESINNDGWCISRKGELKGWIPTNYIFPIEILAANNHESQRQSDSDAIVSLHPLLQYENFIAAQTDKLQQHTMITEAVLTPTSLPDTSSNPQQSKLLDLSTPSSASATTIVTTSSSPPPALQIHELQDTLTASSTDIRIDPITDKPASHHSTQNSHDDTKALIPLVANDTIINSAVGEIHLSQALANFSATLSTLSPSSQSSSSAPLYSSILLLCHVLGVSLPSSELTLSLTSRVALSGVLQLFKQMWYTCMLWYARDMTDKEKEEPNDTLPETNDTTTLPKMPSLNDLLHCHPLVSTSSPRSSTPTVAGAGASIIDPSTISLCHCCHSSFHWLRFRYVCRFCGCIYCDDCTRHRVTRNMIMTLAGSQHSRYFVDDILENEEQRICDLCYIILEAANGEDKK